MPHPVVVVRGRSQRTRIREAKSEGGKAAFLSISVIKAVYAFDLGAEDLPNLQFLGLHLDYFMGTWSRKSEILTNPLVILIR